MSARLHLVPPTKVEPIWGTSSQVTAFDSVGVGLFRLLVAPIIGIVAMLSVLTFLAALSFLNYLSTLPAPPDGTGTPED